MSSSTVVLVTFLGAPGIKTKDLGFFVERQPPDQFTVHMTTTARNSMPFGYLVIN